MEVCSLEFGICNFLCGAKGRGCSIAGIRHVRNVESGVRFPSAPPAFLQDVEIAGIEVRPRRRIGGKGRKSKTGRQRPKGVPRGDGRVADRSLSSAKAEAPIPLSSTSFFTGCGDSRNRSEAAMSMSIRRTTFYKSLKTAYKFANFLFFVYIIIDQSIFIRISL